MARSKPHAELYSHKILSAVVEFLHAAGAREQDIRQIVDGRLTEISRRSSLRKGRRVGSRGDDTVSAAVLHRWHRDRNLLDESANPKPLRLYGRSPSVESVVRSEKPARPAKEIVDDMLALGLLRKSAAGMFLPKARVATIGTMHPVLIEHVSKSLIRLLETVQANTSATDGTPPLIERFTHIPDLPISRTGEFRKFSQEHGSAFLASVDDWLEARRVRNTSRRSAGGTAAGIHVYAYIGRPAKRPRATRRAKRA
jgi:hypothetical protein